MSVNRARSANSGLCIEGLGSLTSWRLISWNVAGRVRCLSDQAAALVGVEPDVVPLQEITASSSVEWRRSLTEAGLGDIAFSFDLTPATFVPKGPRKYGLILASRWPLDTLSPDRFQVPWPERVLSAMLNTPFGPVEINTTHVPPARATAGLRSSISRDCAVALSTDWTVLGSFAEISTARDASSTTAE